MAGLDQRRGGEDLDVVAGQLPWNDGFGGRPGAEVMRLQHGAVGQVPRARRVQRADASRAARPVSAGGWAVGATSSSGRPTASRWWSAVACTVSVIGPAISVGERRFGRVGQRAPLHSPVVLVVADMSPALRAHEAGHPELHCSTLRPATGPRPTYLTSVAVESRGGFGGQPACRRTDRTGSVSPPEAGIRGRGTIAGCRWPGRSAAPPDHRGGGRRSASGQTSAAARREGAARRNSETWYQGPIISRIRSETGWPGCIGCSAGRPANAFCSAA